MSLTSKLCMTSQEVCNYYLRILPKVESNDVFSDFFDKPFRINQKEFPYSLHTAEVSDKTGLWRLLNWNLGFLKTNFKKTASRATSNKHGYELTGEIDIMTHLVNKNKHIVTIDMHNKIIRLRKVPKNFYSKYYTSYKGRHSYVYSNALNELVETDIKNGGHTLETSKFRDNKDIKQLITDCPLVHEIKLEDGQSVCYDCGVDVLYYEFAPNDVKCGSIKRSKDDKNCTCIKVT